MPIEGGFPMRTFAAHSLLAAAFALSVLGWFKASADSQTPLGLTAVRHPQDNPPTAEKIALGERLFLDKRFSATGEVSCSTCHLPEKAFTDGPLSVSEGIHKLTGTRNAPTVINSAYFETLFWDGRSPSLEDQALHPFVNPVEMGLANHGPILAIVRTEPEYQRAFQQVFGVEGDAVHIQHVTKAIAAFERTIVAGDSPFDRWYFRGEAALSEQQIRGFNLFVNEGRCVSCHVVEETSALFTDNRFHNIGVGVNAIQGDIPALASEYIKAKLSAAEVDIKVLSDKRSSELGRFAVNTRFDDMGSFKTPTLRNIAVTAPYMHDGSMKTLRETVEHYNNGGVTPKDAPVNDFLSGGIRPLNLTEAQIDDLVAFLESLTSPQFASLAKQSASGKQGSR
jgi:cytochrome c peroxidase